MLRTLLIIPTLILVACPLPLEVPDDPEPVACSTEWATETVAEVDLLQLDAEGRNYISDEPMLAIGCIQAQQCHTGHCPVGITTHDKQLQRGLDLNEKSERVSNYARNLEHTLISLLAATGKRSFQQLTRDDLFLPTEPLEIA